MSIWKNKIRKAIDIRKGKDTFREYLIKTFQLIHKNGVLVQRRFTTVSRVGPGSHRPKRALEKMLDDEFDQIRCEE